MEGGFIAGGRRKIKPRNLRRGTPEITRKEAGGLHEGERGSVPARCIKGKVAAGRGGREVGAV
jgi:hypothetical protein